MCAIWKETCAMKLKQKKAICDTKHAYCIPIIIILVTISVKKITAFFSSGNVDAKLEIRKIAQFWDRFIKIIGRLQQEVVLLIFPHIIEQCEFVILWFSRHCAPKTVAPPMGNLLWRRSPQGGRGWHLYRLEVSSRKLCYPPPFQYIRSRRR
jgi:hypothetical protein